MHPQRKGTRLVLQLQPLHSAVHSSLWPLIPSQEPGSFGPTSELDSEFARRRVRLATVGGAGVDGETSSPDKVAGAVHHLD